MTMMDFYLSIILITFLGTSVLLWWQILRANKNSGPHFLQRRNDWIAPLGLVDVIVAVFIELLSQSLAIGVIFFVTGTTEIDFDDRHQMTWLNFVLGSFQIIAAAAIVAYLWARYQDGRAAGWHRSSWGRDLKLGGIGFLLFVPPTLVLQSVLTQFWQYEHPTMDLISPDSPTSTILSAWLMATIVAPINEEVLFRVVLLGWLLRCFANPRDLLGGLIGGNFVSTDPRPSQGDDDAVEFRPTLYQSDPANYRDNDEAQILDVTSVGLGESPLSNRPIKPPKTHRPDRNNSFSHRKTWPPVFIIAMLFALVHIGQGPAPIPIFFLGLGLCLMYRQTGSLVPCIVTHFLLNTFSMAIFTLEKLYFPTPEPSPTPIGAIQGWPEILQWCWGY